MIIRALISFIVSLLFISFTQVLVTDTYAQETKQVVIINPIRGKDFWQNDFDLLNTSKKEYEVISKNNLPATWLVRYDALLDAGVVKFLKSLNAQQEIGLFLEITPTFSEDAEVKYNPNPNWHYAGSVLLTGYKPEDRKKYIDQAVKKYSEIFGTNPKSVGAWWIDAFSLNYLKEKYDIEANLDVADQYSTDQYQVWGQYWSLPFYPSKNNALLPAQSEGQKNGVVTIQWAIRDPFNAYGNGVNDSTYSVQANDYILHDLDIKYFEKLLNIYPQTTVGLENDFSWEKFGTEYSNQINLIAQLQRSGKVHVKTMQQFAQHYKNLYPNISPDVLLVADNPLGGEGKVVWYQTSKYRIGWFYEPNRGSRIRDLRIYNGSSFESCYEKACAELNLATSFINAIDEVTYRLAWVIDEGKISNISVSQDNNNILISYDNQAGHRRTIKLMPNDIEIDGRPHTLASAILNVFLENESSKKQSGAIIDQNVNYLEYLPNFLVNFVKFIILTILFFILPGYALTRRLLLAIPVGWALFTLVSYVANYLHLGTAIWSLPVISMGAILKYSFPKFNFPRLGLKFFSIILLIILGSCTWLITVVKSGLVYPYGMGFWGPNGHDAIWHLSLINQLKQNVPPENPIFSGQLLTNYHYFYDLLLAESSKLFNLDVNELLFRLFPLVIAILSGVLFYKVVMKISDSYLAAFFATFFLYFGGSFGWIATYLKDKTIGGESTFWSQQAISTVLNPPFAVSVVLFLTGLYIFMELASKRHNLWLSAIGLILVWGSLIEFKAYGGILVLFSFGIVALYKLVKDKDFYLFGVFLGCATLSALVFLPNNFGASSLIIFHPLWLVDSMIDFPDRLGWERLAMAHQPYIQEENYTKYLMVEILGLIIFIVGNLGTRIISLAMAPKLIKDVLKVDTVKMFLLIIFLSGIIVPLFLIQKGTNWNIVQFVYYSLLVINIFAGISLALIVKKLKFVGIGIAAFVLVVTLPTTYSTINHYLPDRPPARISNQELEALSFLKSQEYGTVLTLAFDKNLFGLYTEPRPIFVYTSTAYVSAFSEKPVFIEDLINLEILDIPYKGRLNEQRDFAKLRDKVSNILHRNNIKYIYVLKSQDFEEDEEKMGIKKIFENDEVKIFKVI